MKTIKTLIIATAIASALSPVTSVCARESDTDSDNEQENATAAQAVPITPEEIAEETRIEQFVAKKARHIVIFLPVDLVDIVLGYVKPTNNEIFHVNVRLKEATANNDTAKMIVAFNEGANSNAKLDYGLTLLQSLCTWNDSFVAPEAMQLLIDHKANVHTTEGLDNQTPLRLIIRNNSIGYKKQKQCILLLLNNGADINAMDKKIRITPLMAAIQYGLEKSCIQTLIANGADPDIVNANGRNVWQQAENDEPEAIQEMREAQQKLAQGLSAMLLESDVLKQYVTESVIVLLINDYAALDNK